MLNLNLQPHQFSALVDVFLIDAGYSSMQVIILLNKITGTGLMRTMEQIDSCPVAVFSGIPVDQAQQRMQQLEALGATVELRSAVN